MRPKMCQKEDTHCINGFLKEFGLSVQMRLYTIHKRECVMLFVTFISTMVLALFIGLAGPAMTETAEQRATHLLVHTHNRSTHTLTQGPFRMKSPALSTYSQQLWLIAEFKVDVQNDQSFSKKFQLGVSIEGLAHTHEHTNIPEHSQERIVNRSSSIQCSGDTCTPVAVVHLSTLTYTHYIVCVYFFNLYELQNWYTVNDVVFYFRTYNPAFTKLEIWTRFLFLLTTFVVCCWLGHSLRKYAIYDWSIEQKWMTLLLPLLLLYNNPIFALSFLVESALPRVLDTLFQTTFLATLCLFWLCAYHALRQNERPLTTFYLPKLAIVAIVWICVNYISLRHDTEWDSGSERYAHVSVSHVHTYLQSVSIVMIIVISLYILYLTYLVITAYSELRSMPYFDVRLRFLTTTVIVIITGVVTLWTIGLPPATILLNDQISSLNNHNHNSNHNSSHNHNSNHFNSSILFMLLYSLLNVSVYTMAYIYSPSERALMETHIVRDNPAVSMLNDSDEEVIYHNSHRNRLNSNHQDDSDDYSNDDDSTRPLNRPNHNHNDSD